MIDDDKTKELLIKELAELRHRPQTSGGIIKRIGGKTTSDFNWHWRPYLDLQ